jgi:hypothetical protein
LNNGYASASATPEASANKRRTILDKFIATAL